MPGASRIRSKSKNKMTDVNFVISMFNKNRETATKSFTEFVNNPNEDTCLDIKKPIE